MPNIANYADLIKLLLGEGAKYFSLLMFSVLAIRFWRNAHYISADGKRKAVASACLATAIACGIGYASMRHSLGLLYSSYGMRAFNAGNVSSALSLFQTSLKYWKTPDAFGEAGVCLMLSKQPGLGKQLLDEAKTRRNGAASSFEEFHQGLFYFVSGQPDVASPLLKSCSRNPSYRWDATKMRCIIELDKNDAAAAARIMEPFAHAEIQDYDQVYIVAALKLAEGRTNEARALVDQYYSTNTPSLFKARFERLRASIQH